MTTYMIIGIYGLNNKPPKDQLKAGWIEALKEGLNRNLKIENNPFEFILVYWANLMHPKPLDANPAPYTPGLGSDELPRFENSFLRRILGSAKEALGVGLDKITALPEADEASEAIIARKATDLDHYYKDP